MRKGRLPLPREGVLSARSLIHREALRSVEVRPALSAGGHALAGGGGQGIADSLAREPAASAEKCKEKKEMREALAVLQVLPGEQAREREEERKRDEKRAESEALAVLQVLQGEQGKEGMRQREALAVLQDEQAREREGKRERAEKRREREALAVLQGEQGGGSAAGCTVAPRLNECSVD